MKCTSNYLRTYECIKKTKDQWFFSSETDIEKSMANSCVKVLFPFSYLWFGKQASEA